jgi:transposase-like protein
MAKEIPVQDEDYPESLGEFEERFAEEEACWAYLFALRWPEGFRCPICGGETFWPVRLRRLLQCRQCGHHASVTAGTIFHKSHYPLRVWFRAMWWLTSQKNGASALNIQRILGLGSYKTAWAWLHKLRRAMVRPGRDQLKGIVDVDETYVGGEEAGLTGRSGKRKALVVIAAEHDGLGIGRIRMRRVEDASAQSLHGFIQEAVGPGSTIHTDGWPSYNRIEAKGYARHNAYLDVEVLPRVHRVASLLKRWLLGTHQGAVSSAHLDYYLDEFTFRFNRRKSHHRGKLFYRLLQQAVLIPPTPYKQLVLGVRGRRPARRPRRT